MGQRNETGNTTISHRLTGHEGVIFSINFNKTASLIATVSDDRSIRLWKVTGSLQQINCKVEPLNVMFGHAARVWDVKLLTYSVVSVGEDATCCIWDYKGQMKKKFKGHKGILTLMMIVILKLGQMFVIMVVMVMVMMVMVMTMIWC